VEQFQNHQEETDRCLLPIGPEEGPENGLGGEDNFPTKKEGEAGPAGAVGGNLGGELGERPGPGRP